jgi:hypothetical protein
MTSAGMTLRDYFAGQAVAALSLYIPDDVNGSELMAHGFDNIAAGAYLLADAMLRERGK